MKSRLFPVFALAWLMASGPVLAVRAGNNVRYALVVGNNHGHNPAAPLVDLKHAESEAWRLRDRLIKYGNFDPDRVVLLTGATRGQILEAAARLARLRATDRDELGPLPTLFAFFFTGHGLAGKLLTTTEPLTGQDLARVFRQMDASLTVGFFDACFAGSLDLDSLRAKGVVATPGFNPVAELPAEVLNAEGTMWLVSSRPEELSYEDDRLGGLFTHFFTEAFEQAPADGVGVSLDNMWEFARQRTLDHAGRFGRAQTPEKIVHRLKSHGPVYLSFPHQRSAAVRFEAPVQGTFLLTYEHGTLVERVAKQAGQPMEVSLYPGRVTLSRVDTGQLENRPSQHLNLTPDSRVSIRSMGAPLPPERLGYCQSSISGKGQLPDVVLSSRQKRFDLSLTALYRHALVNDRLLGVTQRAAGGVWLAWGELSFGLLLAHGAQRQHFDTWSVRTSELDLQLSVGWGFDLGGPRLDVEAVGESAWLTADYESGSGRELTGAWLGGGLRLLVPIPFQHPWVVLQARLGLGGRISQGVAVGDHETYALFEPVFAVGLGVPLF